MKKSIFVVIPNYNGADMLAKAVDSVLEQSITDIKVLIVDNGSTDESRAIIKDYEAKDKRVEGILLDKNYGYTGGVNSGLTRAIKEGVEFVAPFNNDAVAHKDWLKYLVEFLKTHEDFGAAACKLIHDTNNTFDSTADLYTVWGLPYPRGRDEPVSDRYDSKTEIFGASGGASLYRTSMLADIGTFDQDFFAYYEDIDLSFRAQMAGYKVGFVPKSIVYHGIGKTSSKMRSGFLTYQFMKNTALVVIKDVPAKLLFRVVPRFGLAYTMFFVKAILDGKGWAAFKGWLMVWRLLPKKLRERHHIQQNRKVSVDYIWALFVHDLPPNAHKLRRLRSFWWKLTGRG